MSGSFLKRGWPLLFFLTCGLVIALQRLHTYHEPLDRDITLYAVVGHEMLAARSLYSDLWDNKPPLLYATFALAEKVAGYGPASIYLLNVLAALVTLAGVYIAGVFAGSPAAGVWSAFFWVLVCMDPNLEANQPNAEVFLNALLIWVFALWILPTAERRERGCPWVIGILCALGILYKPVFLFPVLTLLVVKLLAHINDRQALKQDLGDVAQIGIAGVVIGAAVVGYFAATHRYADFKDAVFVFNRFFATQKGSLLENVVGAPAAHWRKVWSYGVFDPLLPLFLVSALGMGIAISTRTIRLFWALWAAYAVGAYIAAAAPGYFLSHYFQLLIPPGVVGAGWAVAEVERGSAARRFHLSVILGGVLAAGLIGIERPFYRLSADNLSRLKFNGGEFVVTRQAAQTIDHLLAPAETFYNWGWESGLYYYSRRHPPTGVLFNTVLQGGPLAVPLTNRVLGDLQRTPPELIVLTKWSYDVLTPDHPVPRWFLKNYRRVPAGVEQEPFVFLMRQGGTLERRLLKG